MNYRLNVDGSVDLYFEPSEIGEVILILRNMCHREGYNRKALEEALIVLEGSMAFATDTQH